MSTTKRFWKQICVYFLIYLAYAWETTRRSSAPKYGWRAKFGWFAKFWAKFGRLAKLWSVCGWKSARVCVCGSNANCGWKSARDCEFRAESGWKDEIRGCKVEIRAESGWKVEFRADSCCSTCSASSRWRESNAETSKSGRGSIGAIDKVAELRSWSNAPMSFDGRAAEASAELVPIGFFLDLIDWNINKRNWKI